MVRSNLEMYYLSMTLVKKIFEVGIINNSEYLKAEMFLAKKHCIKNSNLYRLNDLTIPQKRVICMIPKEEVQENDENYNQVRHITEVIKKN